MYVKFADYVKFFGLVFCICLEWIEMGIQELKELFAEL